MVPALTVFSSHESRPDDDCRAAVAVVAASSRAGAVEALRAAGFTARRVSRAGADSAEARAALRRPGTVLWCDWHDSGDDRSWHEG